MAEPLRDEIVLLIRCPACSQRFKVGEELRGRTVECGGCEHRFQISSEVILRGPKIYPGERKGDGLNRFHRVPLPAGYATSGVEPVRYANLADVGPLEPTSPLRVLVGCVGVLGMVMIALLLMFGGSRGGTLDGMVLGNRLVMAGFACVLGVLGLLYANPRARGKALLIGLLLSAGMISVPFAFREGSVPLPSVEARPQVMKSPSAGRLITEQASDSAGDPNLVALESLIGTDPLVAEVKRLAALGSNKRAFGLWFRGLNDSNRFLVRNYILRVARADPTTHFYPRSNGDYLLVVSGVELSLIELASLASVLGETERIYQEIGVAEVRINNQIFIEGPIEKLSDKNSPAFYDLNKRELESIDLERVKRAVQRLAEAEPKIYRADISRRLVELLMLDGVDFKGNICEALALWSEKPAVAADAALSVVNELREKSAVIPHEMLALIVKDRNPKVIPILDELWFKNPMAWESLYSDFGPGIEPTLIQRFPQTSGTVRYSAIRILGRVGGADSLRVLSDSLAGADAEVRVLAEQAKAAIQARGDR